MHWKTHQWDVLCTLHRSSVGLSCSFTLWTGVWEQHFLPVNNKLRTDVYFGGSSSTFALYTNKSMLHFSPVSSDKFCRPDRKSVSSCLDGIAAFVFSSTTRSELSQLKYFQQNDVESEEAHNLSCMAVALLWQWCACQVICSSQGVWSICKA